MKRALPALLLTAAALPLLAQTPQRTPRPPTFEVGIEVINLTLSVTDTQNRYVTDLRSADFSVFEDGVKQELSLFTHEDLPISLVLMIDCSASMEEKLPQAQSAAVRFVGTLREGDLAEVIQFNDRVTVLQDFTAERGALEQAIRRTSAAGPTALHNALYVALKDLGRQKRAGELRRRAIVLLSDGEDTASLVSDEQVIELARKSELAVYAVSLRSGRASDRTRLAFSQAQHFVTVLTRDSGGQVFFPAALSELESVYDRIAEELRTQYNIGYVSSNKRRDGKWRRIVVRVPGRDDLQVRHRVGYYGPASGGPRGR